MPLFRKWGYIMIEITREQLEKLYKKQKRTLSTAVGIGTVCWITSYTIYRTFVKADYLENLSTVFTIIALILFIIPFIVAASARKKLIPAGCGNAFNDAAAVIQGDFMSDRTVNILYQKIGEAKSFAEKSKIILLLCNVYQLRGQMQEALGMLNSIDRSQFVGYPTIGMDYYNCTVDIYSQLEDTQSVLAAYADAEPFIRECSNRNYICCTTAVSILIKVEKAQGNYRKALDLRLLKNDFENQFNKTVAANQQGTPLSRLIKGGVFFETAELFYLNGEYEKAGKYLDIGGPLLSGSPSETERANRLSEKIRDALSCGDAK